MLGFIRKSRAPKKIENILCNTICTKSDPWRMTKEADMFHPLEGRENHSLLPSPFADLEPLAEKWSLATQNQRETRRRASTPTEIRALYDSLLPRMDAILDYLNQSSLESMTLEARRLMYL